MFFKGLRANIILLIISCAFASCKAYKQDILFKLDRNFNAADLAEPIRSAESNYRLRSGDLVLVDVFTNSGERLVDPNMELSNGNSSQAGQSRDRFSYLVLSSGEIKLPIVDYQQVAGKTIDQAEVFLESVYSNFYKDAFVKLRLTNRRVVVLGANGGAVVPLDNENSSLAEVLALYGGLDLGARASNIKVIRGDLSNPQVFQIDLSTIYGMTQTIVQLEAGDIVYVEPWRRPWQETLRDISPVFGLASTLLAFVVVIQNM